MRKSTLGLIAALACLALVLPLAAQEGFPLKGTWLGDWGEGTTSRNQVFVVFDWDGKVISGSINPGTETIAVKNASLVPTPTGPPAAAGGGGGRGAGGGGGRGGGGGQAAAGGGAAPAGGAPAGAAGAPPAQGARAGNGAGASVGPAPVDWVVHFEGDGKDAKGAAVHYVVDGKIENIGLYNRSLTGTWVSGTTKGTFKLVRQ
jgi:hypothetical protein